VVGAYSNLLHPYTSQRELKRLLEAAKASIREPDAPVQEPVQLRRRLGSGTIERIVLEYENGSSVKQLATKHNTSSDGMLRLLREEGVQMRWQHLTPEQIADVVRLYESRLSIYKIQDELGIPKTTVRTALEREGVQMRPCGRATSQMVF
jgi:DNA-directed RNA polymerase specialized sigma24 family protein